MKGEWAWIQLVQTDDGWRVRLMLDDREVMETLTMRFSTVVEVLSVILRVADADVIGIDERSEL